MVASPFGWNGRPTGPRPLELQGWDDLHTELKRLSKEGEWDTMGSLIDDDMLNAFAVVGPVDTIAAALRKRCDGVVDRVLPIFYSASQDCVTAALRELRQ